MLFQNYVRSFLKPLSFYLFHPLNAWKKESDFVTKQGLTILCKFENQIERESACEKESILVSLRNLLTYPFIGEKIENDAIKLYGWHFDIVNGDLKGFNPETKFFDSVG